MSLDGTRPQASVERWGGRSRAEAEGTRPLLSCQRQQPSASTFDLRVNACNRTLRNGQIEVTRAALRRRRKHRQDRSGDCQLEHDVDRKPEPELEAAAQTGDDPPAGCLHVGDAATEPDASERPQRARCKYAALVAQRRPHTDGRATTEPDPRERWERPAPERRDHAPPRGDEPREWSLPQNRDRPLRHEPDAKRVREVAVVARPVDRRE